MARAARRFRGLRGRLALTYALTTLVALLLLELVALVALFLVINIALPGFVLLGLKPDAQQAATYFVHGAPDQQAITAWLHLSDAYAAGTYQAGYLAVADRSGRVIASVGDAAPLPCTPLASNLSSTAAGQLQRLLAAQPGSSTLISREPANQLVVAVPIVGASRAVEGTVIQRADVGQANRFWIAFYARYTVLPSAAVFLLIALITGAIYGATISRGFTRRFARLAGVVDRWSQGDFSQFVGDPSEDEVGQLTRQLNRMAEQLQHLLQTRQALAALEERNRLARDLHDSVKQQVFALSMQLSSAKMLFGRDAAAAAACLNEAEDLARLAKQELTALILELRPAALHERGLAAALSEYVAQWSQQTGIAATTRMTSDQPVAPDAEEALYRVAQEALSNVARHSQASTVEVSLSQVGGEMRLAISDNGQGFDGSAEGRGLGLRSMRERVQALGGDVEVTSAAGQGTTVLAHCESAPAEVTAR